MTSTNRNRVQAGVPTGGEFATEARAENDDLDSGVAPMDKGERNAEIHGIVQHFVDQEIMKEVPALNGGPRFSTGDLYVGRDKDGNRLFAQVELEWSKHPKWTTDMEQISGAWSLSVTGTFVEKGRKLENAGGDQIDHRFIAEGGQLGEFGKLWEKNHMNTFTAGTEPQMVQAEEIKAECMKQSSWGGEPYLDADTYHNRCFAEIPVDRGYRWGTAWLTRELEPTEVQDTLYLLTSLNFKAEQKVK